MNVTNENTSRYDAVFCLGQIYDSKIPKQSKPKFVILFKPM